MSRINDDNFTIPLLQEGYFHFREKTGRGVCAMKHFGFTIAIVYGIDETGYTGRYCFKNLAEAQSSFNQWDGIGDPPGNWIKHKGGDGEYPNPKNDEI